jgi:murein DD-endopeptidase MepM/ murein hydrolase activator NlpD
MNKTFYAVASFVALAFPRYTHAQQPLPDTTASSGALVALPPTAATTARLLSGTEYLDYTPGNTIGNQFYLAATAQPGNVYYDGRYFVKVPLLYDLKLDQLILADTVRRVKLRLINERVAFFVLDGRRFVRLGADSATGLPAGFYQLLLAGRTQLLIRRSKRVAEELVQQHLSFVYKETARLFVKKDGRLTEINKLKTLLDALADRKPELQKFARSQKLKFSPAAREVSAVQLVSYYNSL